MVAAVLLVIATAALGTAEGPGADGRTGPSAPGDAVAQDRPAPGLSGPLLTTAGSFSLAAQAGSVVVVNFWASWCHACKQEAPTLASAWRRYHSRRVRFVGVDYEDGRSSALAAVRSFDMRYPSVIDADGDIGGAFAIHGLPSTYIIGPDGRIRYMVIGRIDPGPFDRALRAILRSEPAGTGP